MLSMVGIMAAQFCHEQGWHMAARAFPVVLSMVGILAALVVSYCEHGWRMAAWLEECVCVFYVCDYVCDCV